MSTPELVSNKTQFSPVETIITAAISVAIMVMLTWEHTRATFVLMLFGNCHGSGCEAFALFFGNLTVGMLIASAAITGSWIDLHSQHGRHPEDAFIAHAYRVASRTAMVAFMIDLAYTAFFIDAIPATIVF